MWRCSLTYLHRHGPQVGAEEQEPHQLVGLYGNQVVDLPQCHLTHWHVGGGQTQDLVVDHRLNNETVSDRFIMSCSYQPTHLLNKTHNKKISGRLIERLSPVLCCVLDHIHSHTVVFSGWIWPELTRTHQTPPSFHRMAGFNGELGSCGLNTRGFILLKWFISVN